jgi:3-dehydroquinate dehydratase-1
MKLVAALTDIKGASLAEGQGADIVELRFDLMDGEPLDLVQQCKDSCRLPVIATFRSVREGGRYAGNADEWLNRIAPVIPFVDYADVEQGFSAHAPVFREKGVQVIASYHTGGMPGLYELFDLERHLRTFSDIVKIIVTPQNTEDLIKLIKFTHAIKQPLCTGVMGTQFRYARAILPLFGSALVYCSVGTATAEGQYTVAEFRKLMSLMLHEP